MPALKVTVPNEYKLAKGNVLFGRRRADGSYEHYRMLGNCPAKTLAVETENYQHRNSQGGVSTIDLDVPISVTRSGNVTIDNLNMENMALYFAALVTTFNQTSQTGATETLVGVGPERLCQIGTALNIAGVRNITAVVPVVSGAARVNSASYKVGDIYQPATPNNHLYACTVEGAAAASAPTFTTDGTTFADGTATFIDLGVINGLTADTDYVVDGPNGMLCIPAGGKIAALYNAGIATSALVDATTGEPLFSINVAVTYNRPANVRKEIKAGSATKVRGRLMFKAENPEGEDQDAVIPDVAISPAGDLSLIGEDEASTIELALGINIVPGLPPVVMVGASKAA